MNCVHASDHLPSHHLEASDFMTPSTTPHNSIATIECTYSIVICVVVYATSAFHHLLLSIIRAASRLGGDNRMGPIFLDDVVFVPLEDTVEHVGQVLGIVVGVSQEIAERGARAVAVQYENLEGNKHQGCHRGEELLGRSHP